MKTSRRFRRFAFRPLLEKLEDRTVPSTVPAPAGILSWWAGDDSAADLIGPNTGTLHGGVSYFQGVVADGFNFDTTGYLSAGSAFLPTASADRTLEMWVKVNNFGQNETFFAGYGNFGTNGQTFQLGADATHHLFFSQWGAGVTGPVLTAGKWYHVAATDTNGSITLYLNGAAVGTGSPAVNTPVGTTFYIGRIPGNLGNSRLLNGKVDEVSVYNRALSASELTSIYQAGVDGKQKQYMVVDQSSPSQGETVRVPPIDYTIDFSNPVLPSSLQASDFKVNGIPADSFTFVDANTVTFHYNVSPVTAKGSQTMSMAAGSVLAANSIINPALLAWTKTFSWTIAVVDVLTFHNDTANTGQNLQENILDQTNVNSTDFGQKFAMTVDGQVYAQPLVKTSINITTGKNQGIHDIVLVATQNDSVYAFDAFSGVQLWQTSFIDPKKFITTVSSADVKSSDIFPQIGITSTPVIDPASGTLYVVAKTKEVRTENGVDNTHFVFRLHALSLSDGSEKFGGPATIADTISNDRATYIYVSGPAVNGIPTADGVVDNLVTFDGGHPEVDNKIIFNALREGQRPALTLAPGVGGATVYVAFASHGDVGPYHGWILGYNAASLGLSAAFCTTPNGGLGGIWESGGPIAFAPNDVTAPGLPNGAFYVETGNGTFEEVLDGNGFPNNYDYGDTFLKLAIDPNSSPQTPNFNGWGLKVVDYFTPFNEADLNAADADLGSSGPLILPDSVGINTHPHLMIGTGKEGRIYLIDRDRMGKFDPNADHVLEEAPPNTVNGGAWSNPSFFKGKFYYTAIDDNAKNFSMNLNGFDEIPNSVSPDGYTYPGATASISAFATGFGTVNGIAWQLSFGDSQLRAYAAGDLSNELFVSNPGDLDALTKFSLPTVANGVVYVGTRDQLVAFGLFNPPVLTPATPTLISAVGIGPGDINVTWQPNSTDDDAFVIERAQHGSASFAPVGLAPAGSSDFTDAGIAPNTTYDYRVKAINYQGESGYSATVSGTTLPFFLPTPFVDQDVGVPDTAGSGTFIAGSSTYQLAATGNFLTGSFDNFNFLFHQFNGDGSLTARIAQIVGAGPNAPVQAGLMIREQVAGGAGGDSTFAAMSVNADGDALFNYRAITNNAGQVGGDILGQYPAPSWVRLVRANGIFTGFVSSDGQTWVEVGHFTVGMNPQVFAGLYITNLGRRVAAYARFDNVQIDLTPPWSPALLHGALVAGPQVNLGWTDESDNEDSFTVLRSTDNKNFSPISPALPAGSTSYTDTSLTPGVTYYYQVIASNGAGNSSPSNTVTIAVPSLPATPSNPQLAFLSTTEVDFSWQDNATNEDGYQVYRKVGNGAFALVANLPPNSNFYQDTTLTAGTQYTFRVIAFNISGQSAPLDVTVTTPPTPPTNLKATPLDGQITLTWKAPFGAVSYNVYRGTVSGNESGQPVATGLTTTSFVDTGLTDGTTYYYVVTAVDAGGESARSAEASAAPFQIHFSVGLPAGVKAGSGFSVTVTALDPSNTVVSGYTGTVHFTTSDPGSGVSLPADYTFVAADKGDHTFSGVVLVTAGSQTITATDTVHSSILGSGTTIVSAANASTFIVGGLPPAVTAGNANTVTVTALDKFGNVATGYTGTVHFTSSDSKAGLPADYTFKGFDNGVHSFNNAVTFKTAGTQSVTATDKSNNSVTGSASTTVQAAAASKVAVAAPGTVSAGVPFNFTVTLQDAFGNTAVSYTGTIHFSSSDAAATLPADYGFVAGDQGAHTFSATLATTGTQTLTATDTINSSITASASVKVTSATATHFGVSLPAGVTAGSGFSFTVTALDQFDNVAAGYVGTIHFTSSDGQAALPADFTFASSDKGTHTFNATLRTAGDQTVTATDTADGTVTGSGTTTVGAAAVDHFQVSAPSTAPAGTAFTVTVLAQDAFGNTATGYSGTVHFTSTDPGATLPADRALVNGGATFVNGVTFVKAGNQTLTIKDTANANLKGTAVVAVSGGPAAQVLISGPSSAIAGAAFGMTLTVKDAYGNVAGTYTGTVHFSSSDPKATLPADFTFSGADQGKHSFPQGFTLKTAGTQTIAVADLGNGALTASTDITVSPGTAKKLIVGLTKPATAGVAVDVTITALDNFGNVASGYAGAVHFTSSDAKATVPADYTFTGADQGMHTFTAGAIFRTAGKQTVTATDKVTSTLTGTGTETVNPAAASQLALSAPSSAAAGKNFTITVTATDAFGNKATGYSGTVHFTSGDPLASLPADYSFLPGDKGAHAFTTFLATAGDQSITVKDINSASLTASATVHVTPGSISQFRLNGPGIVTAGGSFNLTVTAADSFGNAVTGYTGTVHLTSSDTAATLPGDFKFTAADKGTHTFTGLVLRTAGSQTVQAADTANASLTGSASITVNPGAATHLQLSAPGSATAGSAFNVTVTALDQFNNTATGYAGTVHFTSSDGQAVLPADQTLSAGSRIFAVTLKTAGAQTLNATDKANGSLTATASISVSAAAVNHFGVSAPATSGAGNSFSITVTALDPYGNVAAGYNGTVRFSSSDVKAVLPGNYPFAASDQGVHTFTGVVLKTSGAQTVNATDNINASISGAATVTVSPGAAAKFGLGAPSSATAGSAFDLVVTALDQFGNIATGYAGTVHLTSGDAQAVLPANYAFKAGDQGVHTFAGGVTLKTAGLQSVTATDTSAGSLTGIVQVQVSAAGAAKLGLSAGSSAVAGTPFSLTVTVQDIYNNTVTGYAGTIALSSSDAKASLPPNYTFTGADQGVHTFSNGVTLKTAGSQTLGAVDTVTSSIAGSTAVTVSPGAASKLVLTAPSSAIAGLPFGATVALFDAFGNAATGYNGTVHFTSSDGLAALPGDYTFTAADAGVHTFGQVFTLKDAGSQTLTATDAAQSSVTGGASVTVISKPVVTGSDVGSPPEVKVIESLTGQVKLDFLAYAAGFTGGVRVALADVNGDGVPEIITTPGPTGGPDVRVFSSRTGQLVGEFLAYAAGFTGGVYVAAADLNGDGKADIVTAPDATGGPDIRVFNAGNLSGTPNAEFLAYSAGFTGGVRVAVGDVNGDGTPDIVTAPGASGGPDIRVFSGKTFGMFQEYLAYAAGFTGGVYVAAGDVNGDGKADVITGPGFTGGPDVRVFSGVNGAMLKDFMAYDPAFTGGVRVAALDANGDGKVDIVTAAGPSGGPHVKVFSGTDLSLLDDFFAYNSNYTGGVFVGGQ